jgi:hypothetical protein
MIQKPSNHPPPSQRLPKVQSRLLMLVGIMLAITSAGFILEGCAIFEDPQAELHLSKTTFAATVNALAELNRAGQIGDDEADHLSKIIHAGQHYLQQWEAALAAGEKDPEVAAAFRVILADLLQSQETLQ